MRLLGSVKDRLRTISLPAQARAEVRRDRQGLAEFDCGPSRAVTEAVAWLCRAQDNSASQDSGVARDFSLLSGWAASYPETTGYIIPTLLDYARREGAGDVRERAKRMLDWLVAIQFPEGGFQGGHIDSKPVVPGTFNTGQILLGLAAGVRAFGDRYREPLQRAGDWLVRTQDSDGGWRRFPTPFAAAGEKVYETHVAWGLLEAARVAPARGYAESALANIRWALRYQRENGWFDHCCLTDPTLPLTHTIGYALRGIVEGFRFFESPELREAAERTAKELTRIVQPDGYLPGRLTSRWTGAVPWACLTGSVQIAYSLLLLDRLTNSKRFTNAGLALNKYVRRTLRLDGPDGIRGGVKGSFPVNGDYGAFQYLSWAANFFVAANTLEIDMRRIDSIAAS